MDIKEAAEQVYDKLFENDDNVQLNIEEVQDCFISFDDKHPVIQFAVDNTYYKLTVTESDLGCCRWCNDAFDVYESEYKHLCSQKCHDEEQACQ
jgi:hypothetical protein